MRRRRSERGYVLAEALVGGAVLMLALVSVLSGLSQANGHVARAVSDQGLMQALTDQTERLRALPISDTRWDAGLAKPCLPSSLPPELTCRLDIYAETDNAFGGAAVPVPYRRAVVTLRSANAVHSLAVLKW